MKPTKDRKEAYIYLAKWKKLVSKGYCMIPNVILEKAKL